MSIQDGKYLVAFTALSDLYTHPRVLATTVISRVPPLSHAWHPVENKDRTVPEERFIQSQKWRANGRNSRDLACQTRPVGF